MSIETPAEPQADVGRGSTSARKQRRANRPGLSMMAEGEPLVWLTGGSLALSFAMIIGLLVVVLIHGLPAFWPVEVIRVSTLDGRVHMGEVTRREMFYLSSDVVSGMSEESAIAARTLLGGKDEAETHRRLIRTGNFQLTNEHFNWISDFEIKDGPESGVVRPEWAAVVERVEWGRFYGEPQEFAVRYLRSVSGEEEDLQKITQFLQMNQFRFAGEPELVAELSAAMQPLVDAYQELSLEQSQAFADEFETAKGKRLVAILSDGQTVALSDRAADQVIDEIQEVWDGAERAWPQFIVNHQPVRDRLRQRLSLEKHDIGQVNSTMEEARLSLRQTGLRHDAQAVPLATQMRELGEQITALKNAQEEAHHAVEAIVRRVGRESKLIGFARTIEEEVTAEIAEQRKSPEERLSAIQGEVAATPLPVQDSVEQFLRIHEDAAKETAKIQTRIDELRAANERYQLRMVTADGRHKSLALNDIVRAYMPNQLDGTSKLGIYLSRWGEYLWDEPREANSEGGVFPAIFGTVVMTLIMSLVVVPFGVLAALYLREYARGGVIVSAVRIAINNLAGVPSIVFGVFGLGFFCYLVGTFVDGGPRNAGIPVLANGTWWGVVGVLGLVSFVAFLSTLFGITNRHGQTPRWKRALAGVSPILWLTMIALLVMAMATAPFFEGFFQAHLPNPKFGKGGLLWASLTLALLTLPVVIVATEEALSAVPNSLREGSYAAGASKWQTIWRIVLPHAAPGIMTGMILAMARGAGEVAPLMLVGAVKLAPELPVALSAPFGADRSFMHLGFHIYDLGFQSQNSEAAKPMVFTTTLLLIGIIATMNVSAIALRSRLRKRFQSSQF